MVKYCPMCGSPNPDNAMFCVRCGYRFSQVVQPIQQGPQMQQPMQQYPQQYYVQSQTVQFRPPPSPYPPSYLVYNRKYFSMIAGILAGLMVTFLGLSGLLGMIELFNALGSYSYFMSGTLSGFLGSLLVADIVYLVIGIFVLIFGIKKSFTIARITGIIVFIYFLMYAIAAFVVKLNTQGVLLVLGAAFILIASILSRVGGGGSNYMQDYFQQSTGYYPQYNQSSVPIGKIIGYSFGLVGIILTYFGLFGIYDTLNKYAKGSVAMMEVSYFGNNILGMVAGTMAMIGLLIHAFSKSSNTTKHVANIILEIGLILLGVGQIIVGVSIISKDILTGVEYLPGLLAAAAYMAYIGGIIDLIAGIFAIIVAIFFMIEDIMKMSGRLAEEAI
jgi:hypothetical protein